MVNFQTHICQLLFNGRESLCHGCQFLQHWLGAAAGTAGGDGIPLLRQLLPLLLGQLANGGSQLAQLSALGIGPLAGVVVVVPALAPSLALPSGVTVVVVVVRIVVNLLALTLATALALALISLLIFSIFSFLPSDKFFELITWELHAPRWAAGRRIIIRHACFSKYSYCWLVGTTSTSGQWLGYFYHRPPTCSRWCSRR